MARPHQRIVVSEADRKELEGWLRKGTTQQSLVVRARVILLTGEGKTVPEVMKATGLGQKAVYEWRRRYVREGLAGLLDRPRPGQPRKVTPEKAAEILKRTVEEIPHEATHWSLRLMASYAGVTPYLVSQVWKAADLKPHRLKSFKISDDPHFAEKVQDVVGLYVSPPDNALVLSVDEKTQIQALDRTQPMLQLRPKQVERRTHDYVRHGTRSLYAAFDIATGRVLGRVTKQHRARDFIAFLQQIERSTPKHLDLHLIVDNSSTHTTQAVKDFLDAHPRFHMHFTPTSASWLNAVEGWFGQLERRALYRGIFCSVKELRDEIHRYITAHNEHSAKPFRWTKTAEAIIQKVENIRKQIAGSD
jgi:transposase